MSTLTTSSDPTGRFSSRVADYRRFRPGYPPALLDFLAQTCALSPRSVIADIGSGTGLLSQLFLENGNMVYGVEPNAEMRAAGEQMLGGYPQFVSVAARAEATTLPDASVDFVTAGQAFHWFDHETARREFGRILRPGGWTALVWNDRQVDATPFLVEYEQLLRAWCPDYARVTHKEVGLADLQRLFGPSLRQTSFDNVQRFDLAGLTGRLFSSSYAPLAGDPNHAPLLAALQAAFQRHSRAGAVEFLYTTQLYYVQI